MDGIDFIQDLAVVLLAAGLAGVLCKRVGLSVIVGYLAAGIAIGPNTPPFSFVSDVDRIQTLSQVGLVFLMFAIGLGLSLTKLGRLGLPTLLATGLGAFFVLNLTQALGLVAGWSTLQSLFVASMFMVSSSAVIAKIVDEQKLSHDGAAQRALGITVMEDVVAVVMLTILAGRVHGGAGEEANVGGLLATMSAFVVLLVGAGLLLVPRLFRRLESRADPELQTIIVAGVLFLLAILAAKAGYSLALGAFLLGAIVAEMPQKSGVEKSFAGMRDVFSSVFFVSIGMMIDPRLLLAVWPQVLGLFAFVMVARPLGCGVALVLCGTPLRDARGASLLLTPLGEFSFIIAQLGVGAAVLPKEYYPLAVGVSILTVLATPLVNRHSDTLLRVVTRIEPRWVEKVFEAYHGWLRQLQAGRAAPLVWRLTRGRLIQVGVEMMLVTGVLIFSPQLQTALINSGLLAGLEEVVLGYVFWAAIGLLTLVLLFAIWRNLATVAMIFAESVGSSSVRLHPGMIDKGLRAVCALILGYWLYWILPVDALPGWGWLVIVAAALVLAGVCSNRLIYWHSSWQSSLQDVFVAGPVAPDVRADARVALDQGLEGWGLRLADCVLPDNAMHAGQNLATLGIPSRFGCTVIEIERNGHVITSTGPDLRVYPGDKVLLLGAPADLEAARAFLVECESGVGAEPEGTLRHSVLETATLPAGLRTGQTLAELGVARATGVRIVGIQRGEHRILNPGGGQTLEAGDALLAVGTLDELRAFRRWLEQVATA